MRRVLVELQDCASSARRGRTHVMVPEDSSFSDVLAVLNEAYASSLWGVARVRLTGVALSEDPSGHLSHASSGIKIKYMLGDGDILVVSPTQDPAPSKDGSPSAAFGQVSQSTLSPSRVTSVSTNSEAGVSSLTASLDKDKFLEPPSSRPNPTKDGSSNITIPREVRANSEERKENVGGSLTKDGPSGLACSGDDGPLEDNEERAPSFLNSVTNKCSSVDRPKGGQNSQDSALDDGSKEQMLDSFEEEALLGSSPMQEKGKIRPNDILFGKENMNRLGNQKLRAQVGEHLKKDIFAGEVSCALKRSAAVDIYEEMLENNPGQRFLRLGPGGWEDQKKDEVIKKICRMVRHQLSQRELKRGACTEKGSKRAERVSRSLSLSRSEDECSGLSAEESLQPSDSEEGPNHSSGEEDPARGCGQSLTVLTPKRKRGLRWTDEETAILQKKILERKQGKKGVFQMLASVKEEHFPNRTLPAVQQKYTDLLKRSMIEDEGQTAPGLSKNMVEDNDSDSSAEESSQHSDSDEGSNYSSEEEGHAKECGQSSTISTPNGGHRTRWTEEENAVLKKAIKDETDGKLDTDTHSLVMSLKKEHFPNRTFAAVQERYRLLRRTMTLLNEAQGTQSLSRKEKMRKRKRTQPFSNKGRDRGIINDDFCSSCADNDGELLHCDFCEKSYHPQCHIPQISVVPEGKWKCMICTRAASKGQNRRCGQMKKAPASSFHTKDTNDEIISKLEICTRIPSKSSRCTLMRDKSGSATEPKDSIRSTSGAEKSSTVIDGNQQGSRAAQLNSPTESCKGSGMKAAKQEKTSHSDGSNGRVGKDSHGETPFIDLSSDDHVTI